MRVVASLATMKQPGRELSVREVIRSLAPQVDALVVHFNGFSPAEVRDALRHTAHNVFAKGSPQNLGDQQKFLCVDDSRGADWRLTCDDDLLYPPDYVQRMIHWASKLNAPVSAHGSLLKRPFNDFARDRTIFHFASAVSSPVEVDLLGTGTLCWFNNWHRFEEDDFGCTNIADVWASVAFKRGGFPLYVMPHEAGWVRDGIPGNHHSIWAATNARRGGELDTGDAAHRTVRSFAGLFNLDVSPLSS